MAISNKLPTLQAYFQPKQEVTASIVFAMPQTYWDRAPNEKPAPPKTTGNHYVSPHGVTIYADGTPVPPDKKRPPSPTSDIVIAGLNRVDGIVPDSLSIRKKTPSLDRNHAMILVFRLGQSVSLSKSGFQIFSRVTSKPANSRYETGITLPMSVMFIIPLHAIKL